MKKVRSGSIVVFSLMMLSLIALITQQLIKSAMVGSKFIATMVDREHAEMLALGGVNIAIAQLNRGITAFENTEKKEEASKEGRDQTADEKDADKKDAHPMQDFIEHLLAHLNCWQHFEFDTKQDGLSGLVSVAISSEHGKININEVFDFKKQAFKKEYEALLKTLEIPGLITGVEFHKRLEDFFKKRGKKIHDVSELIPAIGLQNMSIFYQPPVMPLKRQAAQPNMDVYLTDIFTIWSGEATIDPLVMSDSVRAMFGLRRSLATDAQLLKEAYKKVAEVFQPHWGRDWEGNWQHIQPIIGEKGKAVSALKDIFSKTFKSQVYSVLSYAKVNSVEQRLVAIIKLSEEQDLAKDKEEKNTEKSDGASQDTDNKDVKAQDKEKKVKKKFFKIIRIYWL